ncbi:MULTISPECIES: hypothetical protein [unclassified Lysinibacillus]|nr:MULTISPECIES: hypothetical protein [unclassified Lysinibacillus]MDM5249089.1 hypothetical protein [Lysinibacillus sp. G4S2]
MKWAHQKVVDDICFVYKLIVVKARRPQKSAQSERKSTTRFGEEP